MLPVERRSPKQTFAIRCPTCGAKAGEKCELGTGQPRNTPHRDRLFRLAYLKVLLLHRPHWAGEPHANLKPLGFNVIVECISKSSIHPSTPVQRISRQGAPEG